jgi:ubiquinone/menaquinone biosynthesis C-methylase UbiE
MMNAEISIIPESTAALCEHPAVRDAVACRLSGHGNYEVVAFLLADEGYVDNLLGGKEAENSRIRKWRKMYDLMQLTTAAAASPFGFNIAGWNSSYTRQPIPADDMREWVQTTVDRISTLRITDVLEIGCGTGLLLLRLAPICQRYIGIDFAPSVLTRLREQLVQREDIREKVELLERSADNLEGFAHNSFSTVILNSVAQHFPSLAYLDRVIENAIRLVKPGGHLFVGDQRSLPLLEAHALSIEAFEAPPKISAMELRSRRSKRVQQEQQLVLAPSYFLSLQQRFPQVSRVEIFPRRGSRDNEMTRFRFDAILSIGADSNKASKIPFLDPPAGKWTIGDIQAVLSAGNTQAVGFSRIANSRIEKDVQLLIRLSNADPVQALSELRNEVDQLKPRGIHPEEIFRTAAETGYEAAVSWASCYRDGSYDAAFVRKTAKVSSVEWPQPRPSDFVHLSNSPGQAETRKKLIATLTSHCQSKLRDELVPRNLHIVDSFPRKTDGNVDCEALVLAMQENGSPLQL